MARTYPRCPPPDSISVAGRHLAGLLAALLVPGPAAAQQVYRETLPLPVELQAGCDELGRRAAAYDQAQAGAEFAQVALEEGLAAGDVDVPRLRGLAEEGRRTARFALAGLTILDGLSVDVAGTVSGSTSAELAFRGGAPISLADLFYRDDDTAAVEIIASPLPTVLTHAFGGPKDLPVDIGSPEGFFGAQSVEVGPYIGLVPRLMLIEPSWTNPGAERDLRYFVGGTLGQVCNRLSDEGRLFTVTVRLPPIREGLATATAELIVGSPHAAGSTISAPSEAGPINHDLRDLVEALVKEVLGRRPFGKVAAERHVTTCWRRDGDGIFVDAESMVEGVAQLRAELRRKIGDGNWPTARQIMAEARVRFRFTSGRYVAGYDPSLDGGVNEQQVIPLMIMEVRHAGQEVGSLVLVRSRELQNGWSWPNDPSIVGIVAAGFGGLDCVSWE